MNTPSTDALAPSAADDVLYRVVHETTYAYATPVELAHHLAHLCPLDHAAQERLDYVCEIHPEPELRHSDVDVFGNQREFFAYYSPHDTLSVRAVSLVRVRTPRAADWAASPAWDTVREPLLYRAGKPYVAEAQYTFGTHFSPLFAAAATYAQPSFPVGRPLLDGALDLMHRIHADFTYNPDSTEVQTRAPQALDGVEPRLLSRLSMGLVADIQAADIELRKKIMTTKLTRFPTL